MDVKIVDRRRYLHRGHLRQVAFVQADVDGTLYDIWGYISDEGEALPDEFFFDHLEAQLREQLCGAEARSQPGVVSE